jgi:hypothetical protein
MVSGNILMRRTPKGADPMALTVRETPQTSTGLRLPHLAAAAFGFWFLQ